MPPEIQEAQALGITLFAGEAENGAFDQLLCDAHDGKLAPVYNHMNKLPDLQGERTPFLPRELVRRIAGSLSSMDLGRGCPYQCSFCTIINVQGRKSRHRTADDVERIIRENCRDGIKRFFITDDNFARNSEWEALFDRMIQLRETEFPNIGFTIQVDTLCHKIPNFIEKAARAGVRRVFIGLENINPDNLIAAKKRQNKITEYREMLQKWRNHGALTCAGYILGFPADTKESILRDIEIIKRELPLDILEFFMLTPLPGSEDHKVLWEKGVWMDPDMNKYDVSHVVAHHSKMSDQEWLEAYNAAWLSYYSEEHRRTVVRRAAASPIGRPKVVFSSLLEFYVLATVEGVHPLEGGVWRQKYRRDRRPTMPIESPFVFYPRLAAETPAQGPAVLEGVSQLQEDARRGHGGSEPLDLHRSRDCAARLGRVRRARHVPCDARWRGCAGAQASRRRHPHRALRRAGRRGGIARLSHFASAATRLSVSMPRLSPDRDTSAGNS